MFICCLKLKKFCFYKILGQILNRFSRDIFQMDDELPWKSFDAVNVSTILEGRKFRRILISRMTEMIFFAVI